MLTPSDAKILKAEEITKPGTYLAPLLPTGELIRVVVSLDKSGNACYTMNMPDGPALRPITDWQTEFYGPIPLPE